ncbi:MAG: hypothetical protein WD749_09940 [Phycisphaerales bacterium]
MSDVRVRLADGREFGPASPEMLLQWAREGRIPASSDIIAADGRATPARQHPLLGPIFSAPPVVQPAIMPPPSDGGVGTLIPYRNGAALTGYYVGVFALVPGFGLLLGPAAVILGIAGFRAYQREPHRKGAAHAWVAIVLGAITSLLNWVGIIALVIAANA